ncbi:MAG: 50S ribosomal protein L22 [Fimbriimonadaceae bacterium]|nr:50S ribosomal protein L22 [Fimbriimonadaceae bacterium]
MEVRAVAKYVRVQPRKVRIVADEVRGKYAEHVVSLLRYHPSKSAKALRNVLISAMANAQENHGMSPGNLRIATIMIDEGPRMKRIQARAMGRAFRIVKKTSHITVVVEDAEPPAKIKPHGTKPKPRPSFADAKKAKAKEKKAAPAEVVAEAPVAVEDVVEETATAAAPVEETTAEAPVEEVVEETVAEAAAEESAPVEEAAETPETTEGDSENKEGAE